MQFHLDILRRLDMLYSVLEKQALIDLQKRTAAVTETTQSIDGQNLLICAARSDERQSVIAGDRAEAIFHAMQGVIAERRRTPLEEILRKREEEREAARRQHLSSRLKREQATRLYAVAKEKAGLEHAQRQQATADDGFLMGKHWKQNRLPVEDR